jgi:hypothetical protein
MMPWLDALIDPPQTEIQVIKREPEASNGNLLGSFDFHVSSKVLRES